MKRRILAGALTLVLASGMAHTAFASPLQKQSDGGIQFTGEAPVTGILDVFTEMGDANEAAIREALQEIEKKAPGSFPSLDSTMNGITSYHGRGADVDFGSHDLAELEAGDSLRSDVYGEGDLRAADIVVVNSLDANTRYSSAAEESDAWALSLSVGEFLNAEDGSVGLEGYSLAFYTDRAMYLSGSVSGTASTYAGVTANSPRVLVKGVGGYYANTFIGNLTLPSLEDTKAGEYKATLTWELTYGPKA